MFNRSEILRKAWAGYRIARVGVFAAGFVRSLFARCLRRAWEEAKKAARRVVDSATAFIVAQRRVQQAAVASMAPEARSARITAIRSELQLLDYAPWDVRTSHRRTDLGAELSMLEAVTA